MTIQKITLSSLILILASFFILSCGNTGTADNAGNTLEKKVKPTKRVGGDTPPKEKKEYVSAYICPMHCKGSGSDTPGKCPVCEMDYVKGQSSLLKEKGRKNDSHEGHNHDSHEGHDHGSHEGHNH